MTTNEERLAVLETETDHTRKDINKLFDFMREHMQREEQNRAELLQLMQQLKTRVDRQTAFVSGAMFMIVVLWSLIKWLT
jgi:uncharacterized coiled-coil protein SlyX